MGLKTINVAQRASQLLQPFQVAHLGYVDTFGVSVFVCQGAIAWHRHIDQDELFLVQSGSIVLETERGSTRLRADEMAVVPKGVEHRSSSFLWSTVLLFRQEIMSNRKNGDRRTAAPGEANALHKINLGEAAKRLIAPFESVELASVEEGRVWLALIQGESSWQKNGRCARFFFPFAGEVTLNSKVETATLKAGEMAIVPEGMRYRLAAAEPAVLLLFGEMSQISLGAG